MRTFSEAYCLYRENPFRVLYPEAHGFLEPPSSRSPLYYLKPWKMEERSARAVAKSLNTVDRRENAHVYMASASAIQKRIREEKGNAEQRSHAEVQEGKAEIF